MKKRAIEYALSFDDGVYNNESAIKKVVKKGHGDESVNVVPNVSAIYCLFSTKDNGRGGRALAKLLYIGKTTASNGFRNRCLQHLNPKREDYLHNTEDNCPDNQCWYTYATLDGRLLEKCEAAMIKQFSPPLNKNDPTNDSPSRIIISGKFADVMKGTWEIQCDSDCD